MTLSFNKKVRKISGNLMVTIPVETAEAGQIEEGDLLTVRINLVTPKPKPKSIRIKDKEIKPKYEIPQELKESVIKALKVLLTDYVDRWVSATEILDIIRYNKLCDLDKIQCVNIYTCVGDIMVSLGYLQTKKISGVKHRLISFDSENKLNGGEV